MFSYCKALLLMDDDSRIFYITVLQHRLRRFNNTLYGQNLDTVP